MIEIRGVVSLLKPSSVFVMFCEKAGATRIDATQIKHKQIGLDPNANEVEAECVMLETLAFTFGKAIDLGFVWQARPRRRPTGQKVAVRLFSSSRL